MRDDAVAFAPYLGRLIDMRCRFAQRKDASRPAYDVLLDVYEKGTSMAMLDPFFELLQKELTPVIAAVTEKPAPRTDFLHRHYPVHLIIVVAAIITSALAPTRECSSRRP